MIAMRGDCPECGRRCALVGKAMTFAKHKNRETGTWCRGTGRLYDEPRGLHAMWAPMGG